jgi:hypothetical protein
MFSIDLLFIAVTAFFYNKTILSWGVVANE